MFCKSMFIIYASKTGILQRSRRRNNGGDERVSVKIAVLRYTLPSILYIVSVIECRANGRN